MNPPPDFTAITFGAGSLILFRAENADARAHLEDSVQGDAVWMHGCLIVEPRYLQTLIDGLEEEGFSVAIA